MTNDDDVVDGGVYVEVMEKHIHRYHTDRVLFDYFISTQFLCFMFQIMMKSCEPVAGNYYTEWLLLWNGN